MDKLHDEQKDLATSKFKSEALKDLTAKKLVNFPVSETDNHLPARSIFIGSQTKSVLDKLRETTTGKEFLAKSK